MIESLASHATHTIQKQTLSEQSIAVLKSAKKQQEAEGRAAVSLIDNVAKIGKARPTGDHTGKLINLRA